MFVQDIVSANKLTDPKAAAQLCDPRFGVCNLISGFGYHLIRPLEARIWGIHDMHNTLWFRKQRVWFRCA